MQKYYKFCHVNKSILKQSSSGGAFTAISDYILRQEHGVIYGCVLNSGLKAIHVRADSPELRDPMRGSKYVGSRMDQVYSQLKEDLCLGRTVLFTGTPCQVAALKRYLEIFHIDTFRLFTIEVICHGVGSEKFFEDYIRHLEERYKGKAISCNFRAKHRSGQKQDMEVRFDNGKIYNASSTKYDWFYSVYLKNLILRPSCYRCKYAVTQREADISIADLWEKETDKQAYSLILINTELGERLFKNSCADMKYEELQSEVHQPHMHEPCKEPHQRKEFWDIYLKQGYLEAQKWLGNNTLKGKLFDCAAKIVYQFHIAGLVKRIRRILYAKGKI